MMMKGFQINVPAQSFIEVSYPENCMARLTSLDGTFHIGGEDFIQATTHDERLQKSYFVHPVDNRIDIEVCLKANEKLYILNPKLDTPSIGYVLIYPCPHSLT